MCNYATKFELKFTPSTFTQLIIKNNTFEFAFMLHFV